MLFEWFYWSGVLLLVLSAGGIGFWLSVVVKGLCFSLPGPRSISFFSFLAAAAAAATDSSSGKSFVGCFCLPFMIM